MLLSDIIEACVADRAHYIAWVDRRCSVGGGHRFMCHAIKKYTLHLTQYRLYRVRIEEYLNAKHLKVAGVEQGECATLSTYLNVKTGKQVKVDVVCPARRALAEKFWRKFVKHLRETGE